MRLSVLSFLAIVLCCFLSPSYACVRNDTATLQLLSSQLSLTGIWVGLPLTYQGVTFSADSCVIGLNITFVPVLNLALPNSIGLLLDLQTLILSGNGLVDPVPLNYLNLVALKYLDMSNNRLQGGGLSHFANSPLTYIDLSHNQISTASLGLRFQPTYLEHLDLSHNNISGLGANNFTNALNLTWIDISYNSLFSVFQLDDVFFFPRAWKRIDLSNNYICSQFAPWISLYINVTDFEFNNNCLPTPLPNWCALYSTKCRTMRPSAQCSLLCAGRSNPFISLVGTQAQIDLGRANKLQLDISPVDPRNRGISLVFIPYGLLELDGAGELVNNTITAAIPPLSQIICKALFSEVYLFVACGALLDNGAYFFGTSLFSSVAFNFTFVSFVKQVDPAVISQSFAVAYWPPFKPSSSFLAIVSLLGAKKNNFTEDDPWVLLDGQEIPVNNTLLSKKFDSQQVDAFVLQSKSGLKATCTLYNFAFDAKRNYFNVSHYLLYQGNSSYATVAAIIPKDRAFPFFQYDPDFGAVVDTSGSDDGGDGFDDSLVAAIVVPVVVFVAFLVVVAVIVTAVVVFAVQKARANMHGASQSMVEF